MTAPRSIILPVVDRVKESAMTNGLEDVVAAETVLSDVDGAAGRLTIRGHALDALAGRVPFEAVVRLLLDGFLDDLPGDDALAAALGDARRDVFARLSPLLPALAPLDLYDGVRAGVALLPDGDALDDALRLVAAPAVLTAALLRLRAGTAPLAPDPSLGHAADLLRMRRGAPAPGAGEDALADALDVY